MDVPECAGNLGLPDWFWGLDYLIAPFLAVILSTTMSMSFMIWMHYHERQDKQEQMDLLAEQNKILSRIATALEGKEGTIE